MNSILPPIELQTGPPEPAPHVERDSKAKIIADFLREAAVLTFVFIPLDLLINDKQVTFWWGVAIVAAPTAALGIGMWIEQARPQ